MGGAAARNERDAKETDVRIPGRSEPAHLRRLTAALEASYAPYRARVGEASNRMSMVLARPHTDADLKDAADEVGRALRAALRTVRGDVADLEDRLARSRSGRRREQVPAALQPWDAELARLGELDNWLHIRLADDLGSAPEVVEPARGHAACGPAIPGMDFASPGN